jgi:hypothetical protein
MNCLLAPGSSSASPSSLVGRAVAGADGGGLAPGLKQTHGAGYDKYFGAFVMATGFVEKMRESGVEYSTHMAFDAHIERLLSEQESSSG